MFKSIEYAGTLICLRLWGFTAKTYKRVYSTEPKVDN